MATNKHEPIPVTAAGIEALKEELADLRARRPAMVRRVAAARSDGDLRENFAYHDARRDLGMLDGRAQTIENTLARAVVIEGGADDGSVSMGARVIVRDEFGESTYSLVGPAEADVAKGRISVESPLGTALLGRRVGDTVTFATPGGERSAEIVSIA